MELSNGSELKPVTVNPLAVSSTMWKDALTFGERLG